MISARLLLGARRLHFKGESPGQAMIYVGIMMLTLIAFAALVINVGFVFWERREFQNAVDAAALAGAQQLPLEPDDARNAACNYGTALNDIAGLSLSCSGTANGDGDVDCSGGTDKEADFWVHQTATANDTITVTECKKFTPFFGAGLGWMSIEVGANATARVGGVGSSCVSPFWMTTDRLGSVWGSNGVVLNTLTTMKLKLATGDFGLLDVGNGANAVRDRLANPADCFSTHGTQTSGTAATKPGNNYGPVDQGLDDRKIKWEAQGNCLNADPTGYYNSTDGQLYNGSLLLTTANCYRMITIPLLQGTWTTVTSNNGGPIMGFLTFYISDWCKTSSCKGDVTGYFLSGPVATSGDYTTYYSGEKVIVLAD
jgi:Flp pilus assembly protein TadG